MPSLENQLTRYGAIAKIFQGLAASARAYFVLASQPATTTYTSGTVTVGSQSVTVGSTSNMRIGQIISIAGATTAYGTITGITSSTVVVVNIFVGGVTPAGAVTIINGANYGDFQNEFPVDRAGQTRVFSTVSAAVSSTNLVAERGDCVFVMPGHTEQVSAAAGISPAVGGINVVGFGEGSNRPMISWVTSAAATITLNYADIKFENFVFDMTGVAALTTGFTFNAPGAVMRNCRFVLANATNQAVTAITTVAQANFMVIEDCVFHGTTTAGTTAAITLVGGDTMIIRRCIFIGAYSAGTGAISNITTATTNLFITDCYINNETALSTKAITVLAGASGHVSNCRMQILSGTAPITGAGMSWVGGNYYAAAIATAGTLI